MTMALTCGYGIQYQCVQQGVSPGMWDQIREEYILSLGAYLVIPTLLRRKASIKIEVSDQSVTTPSADAQVMNHFGQYQYYHQLSGGGKGKTHWMKRCQGPFLSRCFYKASIYHQLRIVASTKKQGMPINSGSCKV